MSDKETLANQIEGLAKKATPGPWRTAHSDPAEGADVWWLCAGEGSMEKELGSLVGGYPHDKHEANASLIPLLVNNLPTILSALRASTQGGGEWSVKQNVYGASFLYAGSRFLCGGTEPSRMTKEDMELIARTMNSAALSSAPSIRDQVIEECARALKEATVDLEHGDYRRGVCAGLDQAERVVRSLSTKPTAGEGWVHVTERLPVYGEDRRVVIYTEGYDFAGEQFFHIKADALTECGDENLPHCGDREVAARASHWIYAEDLAAMLPPAPAAPAKGE